MYRARQRRLLGGFASLVLLAAAPAALAQSNEDLFYRAYYAEHEERDLETALSLYRRVAESGDVASDMRAKASLFGDRVAEDLAASDFARLLPPNTLLYAELNDQAAERDDVWLWQMQLRNPDAP